MNDTQDPVDRATELAARCGEPDLGSTTPLRAPTEEFARRGSTFNLPSGRSIEVGEGTMGERVQIRGVEGEILLAVHFTAEGPVVSVSGASLEIAANKNLSLTCDTLAIKTRIDASFEIGGSLRERVQGSVSREAGGTSSAAAREIKIEAFPGGMRLNANDDVSITGERVRLNSDDPPMPLTWEEHRARRSFAMSKEASMPEAANVAGLLGVGSEVKEP